MTIKKLYRIFSKNIKFTKLFNSMKGKFVMKILIDNCVPLNNGDAALIFSLKDKLKKKNELVMSCLNYKEVKKRYPDEKWIPSYINTFFYHKCYRYPIFKWLWKVVIAIKLCLPNNPYNRSDVIISAPGGYIHSYYGIEARLFILYFCKKVLNKKVGIYSQSIGKLSLKDQAIFFRYAKNLDFIFARDATSYQRAVEYGLSDNLFITKDAAFLLATPYATKENTLNKKVAISLRSWNHEGRNMTVYFQAIHGLVQELLDKGFYIDFLSTCQGIENYVDDSQTAERFIKEYGYKEETKISIVTEYFTLDQLQKKIRTYDYVFGTRLHMCILALVNHVMAFNISYEEKGKECYEYLGMADYCVDFNTKIISPALHKFLNMSEVERVEIFERVQCISNEQNKVLEDLENAFSYERNER